MTQATTTQATLWQGFLAEVAETLMDVIGITDEEAAKVQNLPQDFSNYAGHSFVLNNGNPRGPQYWIQVTPYGYVTLYTRSRLSARQVQYLTEATMLLTATEKRYHQHPRR
jgi:hypothetical protein